MDADSVWLHDVVNTMFYGIVDVLCKFVKFKMDTGIYVASRDAYISSGSSEHAVHLNE